MPEPIAVIGGGWAGMSAALALAEAGVPPVVFEGAAGLGGRARAVEHRGLTLDNGQHLLVGAYSETLALIRRLHARAPLLQTPLRLEVPGHFHLAAPRLPAPLHLALALATARGLPLAERLGAIRLMRGLARRGWRVEPDIPVAAFLALERQGEAAIRHLWEPLSLAALNTPLPRASAQVFAHVLRDSLAGRREASDLVLATTDLASLLPVPAARRVAELGGRVETRARVSALRPLAGGYEVQVNGRAETFRQVVLATDPARAAPLLAAIPSAAGAAALIAALDYEPIYTTWLAYPEDLRLPRPLLGLADGLGQWVFDRGASHGTPGLMALVMSGTGPHEQLPRDQLPHHLHRQMEAHLGPLPAPGWSWTVAERRATFACTPGLERPPVAGLAPGLALAGDYTAGPYPATLEAAVRSGLAAARHLLETTH